jgi:hypothetical protein
MFWSTWVNKHNFFGVHVVQPLVFSTCIIFCQSLFFSWSFFFWLLYCLSFDIHPSIYRVWYNPHWYMYVFLKSFLIYKVLLFYIPFRSEEFDLKWLPGVYLKYLCLHTNLISLSLGPYWFMAPQTLCKYSWEKTTEP